MHAQNYSSQAIILTSLKEGAITEYRCGCVVLQIQTTVNYM